MSTKITVEFELVEKTCHDCVGCSFKDVDGVCYGFDLAGHIGIYCDRDHMLTLKILSNTGEDNVN